MRKFHLYFAIIALASLLVGEAITPNSPIFWLAGTDTAVQVIRGIMIGMLGVQLVTTPPRPTVLRAITLVAAAFALAYGIYAFGAAKSPILDAIVFIHAGLALAITALELQPKTHLTLVPDAK
jgi:hypothetical protein